MHACMQCALDGMHEGCVPCMQQCVVRVRLVFGSMQCTQFTTHPQTLNIWVLCGTLNDRHGARFVIVEPDTT